MDFAGFTVAESAADVDDLRRALGAAKISLIGHSYGTYLALAVIRADGDTVERAALLGTAGPAEMRKLPFVLDTQLAKLSMLAREDPSIGAEVPDMTALLRRVLAKLEREPIAVTITDRSRQEKVQVRIGPEALQRILMADVGDGNDFPVFPALLSTIERGGSSILAWFVEKRYNQVSGPNLMAYGMRCSAGAPASRDREIARQAPLSILGNALNGPYPAVCDALPGIDLGDDFRTPVVSNVPVLFISGTLDSNTPPYQAEQVRWGMPRAMHLIVANAGHEDLEPNEEVQAVIADYFAGKDVSSRWDRPARAGLQERGRGEERAPPGVAFAILTFLPPLRGLELQGRLCPEAFRASPALRAVCGPCPGRTRSSPGSINPSASRSAFHGCCGPSQLS